MEYKFFKSFGKYYLVKNDQEIGTCEIVKNKLFIYAYRTKSGKDPMHLLKDLQAANVYYRIDWPMHVHTVFDNDKPLLQNFKNFEHLFLIILESDCSHAIDSLEREKERTDDYFKLEKLTELIADWKDRLQDTREKLESYN